MPEKWKPHHVLQSIKATFSTPLRLLMTGTAARDAVALGYDTADVVRVIQSIQPHHFYKSMTAHHNQHAWQDVYHVPDGAIVLYVKFTDNAGIAMTVLSFKEK